MAASPRWKVYTVTGEYVAACHYAEDAAAIVACRGDGTTIRDGHRKIVWREGAECDTAGNSYDIVAQTIRART